MKIRVESTFTNLVEQDQVTYLEAVMRLTCNKGHWSMMKREFLHLKDEGTERQVPSNFIRDLGETQAEIWRDELLISSMEYQMRVNRNS